MHACMVMMATASTATIARTTLSALRRHTFAAGELGRRSVAWTPSAFSLHRQLRAVEPQHSAHRYFTSSSSSTMSLTPLFRYINAEELAELIRTKPSSLQVIDVRDDDYAGGSIVGAVNVPSETFTTRLDDLVKTYADVPQVVFHCALSQVRGPKAARRYAEARALITPDAPEQTILVLREGFTGFQQRFRDDKTLVQGFNKFYHD